MMKMEYKLTPEQRELISRRTKEAMAKPEIRLKLCLLNSRARKRVKRRKDYLRNQAMKQENKRREEEKLSEVEKRCLLYDKIRELRSKMDWTKEKPYPKAILPEDSYGFG